MEWIYVGDAEPRNGQKILAYDKRRVYELIFSDECGYTFTHWMNCPEPPNAKSTILKRLDTISNKYCICNSDIDGSI